MVKDSERAPTKSEKNQGGEDYHNFRNGPLEDAEGWEIPLPPNDLFRHKLNSNSSASTPLLRKKSARILFGDSIFGSPTRSTFAESSYFENKQEAKKDDMDLSRPTGLSGFFFGFMYEEPFNESFDQDDDDDQAFSSTPPVWNRLNIALFAAYSLTTAATAVPILLLPTIGGEFFFTDNANESAEASAFTSRAASSAVMGTALGKLLLGPIGDVVGARRTSVLFSFLLALSLLGLASAQSSTTVSWACFLVEFNQSVQWPCILVTLASHYGSNHHAYEDGIYVTSIASRFGSLVGIPVCSWLLRDSLHWRALCCFGAYVATLGCSVSYLFHRDSLAKTNDPQNPLHPKLLHQIRAAKSDVGYCIRLAFSVLHSVWATNVFPSLQHVLKSGTFWIVAVAHTGSSMIRTSERILGAYLHDTSMGSLSEQAAASMVFFSSLGTILGLVIVGRLFSERKGRQRKWLVSRLYVSEDEK